MLNWSPLHYAVYFNNLRIVENLIIHNADINIKGENKLFFGMI